jgi:ATP-binding cassette subfamily B (MDR/TAP) protein 1
MGTLEPSLDGVSDDGEEPEKSPAKASLGEVFRFATALDMLALFIGFIGGSVQGAMKGPGLMILFGEFIDTTAFTMTRDDYNHMAIKTAVVGLIAFFTAVLGNACVESAGLAQSARWRRFYLQAILRQDIGWFDTNNPSELSSKIAANCQDLEKGISSKLVELPTNLVGQGVIGLVVAFWYSWDISLVMLVSSPVVVIGAWYMAKVTADEAKARIHAYGKAGGLASECISELRTVAALGAEKQQASAYNSNLLKAQVVAQDKSWKMVSGRVSQSVSQPYKK